MVEPINKPTTHLHPWVDTAQLHLLGADGLVFCPERKQLYYLNTVASYIWCGLKEGLPQLEISQTLVSDFNISSHLAKQHVHEVLAIWKAGGEAVSVPPSPYPRAGTEKNTPEPRTQFISHQSKPLTSLNRKSSRRGLTPTPGTSKWLHCRIGDMSIRIRYLARSVEGIIRPVLAHLENDDALDNLESSVDIDIVEKNGLFNVHCDEDGRGEFVTGPEVMPLIHQLILKKVFKTSGCLAAFHAGAVCDDTASLLLPAASGSGKSTLVAALVSSGWTYQTDELVLLMPDTSLCPLPISLGLKRGSWPLFKTSIPGLASIPIHHQPDGTEIKYIVPPQLTPLMIHPPLRALVFPKYIDGADTKLTPMSSAKGLYHLAQSGYAVAGDLTPELVATLINWVSKHGCYDLQVGSLDTAVSTVRKLLE